ncbi:hypothetical protein BCV69DRAFT_145637 [Microstroma glucosiphilum]|uniref:Uncharacterized protein n=1 Tax=Pseudomicrostroma glucosiphilum TaxID=1684307 RepID=A0A316UBG7_9BASI|nr:hypothetical protein BCV69DRAFT_145637 [Pseudomicrostroma glucosiphilum]PWN22502.1 hypothetical protein BCV69DRAFT_145637 [Pseudomicrostroma glucosiphilum]
MVSSPSVAPSAPETWATPLSSPDATPVSKPYAAVWQRMNGSPINTSLSTSDQSSPSHVPRPAEEPPRMSISSPVAQGHPSTAAASQGFLDSAALFESLQELKLPESPFRSRFRRLSGASLSGSLFRCSRSDPNLASRYKKAGDSQETLRPTINSALPLCAASPLVCVFGDDGEEVPELSKEEADRGTARGLSRTKAKGLSRSISNLFRRSALDGEKVKSTPTSAPHGAALEAKPLLILEQPGTDSPSVTPSCFSWESKEEPASDTASPRSATLTLKRLATFLRKTHAQGGQSVLPVGAGNDQHSGSRTQISTPPIPAPYTLDKYAFDAILLCNRPSCEIVDAAPLPTQTSSQSGTRRRMNSLISKVSIPRSPRKSKTNLPEVTEPFSPSYSLASGTPLSPSKELTLTQVTSPEQVDKQDDLVPPRLLRDERSVWSDSSVGHYLSAPNMKDESPSATQDQIQEMQPSRRSSGILGEEGSYTTGGFESSDISTASSAPLESPVADRAIFCGPAREVSDASSYDDDSEEVGKHAASVPLQATEGEETIIEVLDSNSYLTTDQTHFEDCATDPFVEADDEDQEPDIHFTADSDEITPATHIFESSGSSTASGRSGGNHFYDVSFASTAPSSRSHGSQQALSSAAEYQYRALPSVPIAIATEVGMKSPVMRHHTSLRDLRGQTIGLPAAERINYLAPKCPCCAGTGREGSDNGRATPFCMHLPLILPTSPRQTGPSSPSCTEGGLRRPPTPSGIVVAMPTSKAPLRKRRASFAIRRSALSCEEGGVLCTCPGSCKGTSIDAGMSRSASSFGPARNAGRAPKPVSIARPMTAGATPYAMF